MLRFLLIAGVALSVPNLALAQDNTDHSSKQTETTMFGAPDCGEWIKKTRPGADVWLIGYLSGLNSMFNSLSVKPNVMYDPLSELSSADQALAWMDNWCKENPLKRVNEGANLLHLTLSFQKGGKAAR